MDQILYKYRTDSPYTEQLITSGEIFLATAHELNDPFECSLQDISKDWLHEKVETDMQAALSGFVMSAKHAEREGGNFFGLDSSAADEALQTILSRRRLATPPLAERPDLPLFVPLEFDPAPRLEETSPSHGFEIELPHHVRLRCIAAPEPEWLGRLVVALSSLAPQEESR